jgi:hypothetical protein
MLPARFFNPLPPVSVCVTASADDTTTLSRSYADCQRQVNLMVEYQDYTAVRSNVQKIEVVAVNTSKLKVPSTLQWGAHGSVPIKDAHHSFRLLGNYFDAAGSNKPACSVIMQKVDKVLCTLESKAVSDKFLSYVIDRVLRAQVSYLWKTAALSPSFLESINRKIRKLFRRKTGLRSGTPNAILHHPNIYNVPDMHWWYFHDHLTALVNRLNSTHIDGLVQKIMVQRFQAHMLMSDCPLSAPPPPHSPPNNCFLACSI